MYQRLLLLQLFLCFFLLQPLSAAELDESCQNIFITHDLAHTTATRGDTVRLFESNGAGLAINDLNNDGLLDVVLGNLNGANSILWNEGDLSFRKSEFAPTGRARMVTTVDVDADGWLDIVLTTQAGAPSLWRNNGDETFTFMALRGVDRPAYVLTWADVDVDGDLDLVTASYDVELAQLLRDTFLFGGGAGVYYYENRGGEFFPTRLADESQALAIWLSDLDANGHIDLMIGNDFSLPDQAWSYVDGAWQATDSFPAMTYSTMSFDAGDLNNDGTLEFFAADMHPYLEDADTLRAWQPVLDDLARVSLPLGNAQVFDNVLLMRDDVGYVNRAQAFGVTATGWSWSSKFGDLDNDGYLDLYVVNGMAAQELFAHLPNNELIEANQALRNEGGVSFITASEWGLGSTASGRGMSMADLDNDGDLDIVVNNLNTPAQVLENDLCGGDSLQVELRDQDSLNRYGLSAVLTLYTSSGTYTRDLRAASGYLSGDVARVHFGFPENSERYRLEVRWTDGTISTINTFSSQRIITLER